MFKLDTNLKKFAAFCGCVTTIIILLNQLGVDHEPLLFSTHAHHDADIRQLKAELKIANRKLDIANGKLAGKDIKEKWVSKCNGVAGPDVDFIMQDDYDLYAIYKNRDHNWRDNHDNPEPVYDILIAQRLC